MSLEAGRVLSDRYRLVRPLGQGSQGAVWIADHLALNTHVAVKLIDPELAKREDARERFKREATAAAQLRSAHVVQILDHGIDGIQPFIVMELLDGEDLFERLNKRGRLSLRETSKVITQVCRALARAHAAGIVHRDLKPENVFLCNNDDEEIVKVLDFGVAKVTDPAKATMQKTGIGTLIGTPHYMSPEQVKGTSEVDSRTDLWAMGVIAYQCVVGELPFDSEGVGDLLIKISIADPPVPSKVFPGVSAAFDGWFAKACERDRAKRFQSARELAEALARVVASVPEAMRGALPPRPTSVRPPPVTPAPTSVRGTKPGLSPAPVSALPKPPALPTAVSAAPVPAPKIVEALSDPLAEQEIDDFDFDFDEEPPVVVAKDSTRLIVPTASPTGSGIKTSPGMTSFTKTSPGVTASAPPTAPLQPGSSVSTPAVAAQPTAPPERPSAPSAQPVAVPSGTNLGAPVFQPGMLNAATPITAPGIVRNDRISEPPEFDGSRKRKTLGVVAVLFVLAIGGVAFFVVQSNMLPADLTPASSVSASTTPELPPVVTVPAPTVSFGAPASSKPTTKLGKPWSKNKPAKASSSTDEPAPKPTTDKAPDKPRGDVVIDLPTPPADDSVPPAP